MHIRPTLTNINPKTFSPEITESIQSKQGCNILLVDSLKLYPNVLFKENATKHILYLRS